jgi:hypothetical protein
MVASGKRKSLFVQGIGRMWGLACLLPYMAAQGAEEGRPWMKKGERLCLHASDSPQCSS